MQPFSAKEGWFASALAVFLPQPPLDADTSEPSDLPAPVPRFGPLQKVPPLSAAHRLWPSHRYALSNWPLLSIYLEDGRLEFDNNLVETPFDLPLWAKRTGSSSAMPAGQRSAILYTIIESCRYRGIDPYAYLRDVLTNLPSMINWQIKHVTPEAWTKT